jgi:hypothetical protein
MPKMEGETLHIIVVASLRGIPRSAKPDIIEIIMYATGGHVGSNRMMIVYNVLELGFHMFNEWFLIGITV